MALSDPLRRVVFTCRNDAFGTNNNTLDEISNSARVE